MVLSKGIAKIEKQKLDLVEKLLTKINIVLHYTASRVQRQLTI